MDVKRERGGREREGGRERGRERERERRKGRGSREELTILKYFVS